MGGVEVDVPVEFTEQDSNDNAEAIHLEKGVQKLNGEEALALEQDTSIVMQCVDNVNNSLSRLF